MLDAATFPALPSHQQVTRPASVPAAKPSGSRLGPRWFVVSTYAQAERRAAQHLAQQGYQTYLPLVTVTRRDRVLRSLVHRVEVPLFPAYLFARFDLRDPWRPITNTPGVFRLLTNASHMPDPVPDAALEAVQAAVAACATQQPESRYWAPGAACSLRKGYAFEGLPGVILAVHGDQAIVSLMFLGHLREITVALDSLEPREDF